MGRRETANVKRKTVPAEPGANGNANHRGYSRHETAELVLSFLLLTSTLSTCQLFSIITLYFLPAAAGWGLPYFNSGFQLPVTGNGNNKLAGDKAAPFILR